MNKEIKKRSSALSPKQFGLKPSRMVLVAALGLLCLLMAPNGFVQNTGPKNDKDANYYNRLLDSIFYDVNRVAELMMDYALTYQRRIDHDFAEWTAGRDMKSPEDGDYFHAIHVLNEGWQLLLKSSETYHQARLRATNDATNKSLYEQSQQLYNQGLAKVKEANGLRKAADEKREARQKAEKQKKDQELVAANQKRADDTKAIADKTGQLNTEEAKENELHNAKIAQASSAPASQRQALLRQEDARHERRMDEIDQRRNDLAKKLDEINSPGSKNGLADYVPPDIAGGDKQSPDPGRSEIVGGERSGDECFPRPAKKYDGCSGTLNKEYDRWQAEVAQNDREIKAENARHNRRMRVLDDGQARPELVKSETECHANRARQLEEEQDALLERHMKCFNLLKN